MEPGYCLILSKKRVRDKDGPGHNSNRGRQKETKMLTKEVIKSAIKLGENIYEMKFSHEN